MLMNLPANLPSNVFLAPMAGITDRPTRQIVNKKSNGHVALVSEMVAINALSRKNPKTYRIADVREEKYPVIVQLVGSNPALFADFPAGDQTAQFLPQPFGSLR